MRPLSTSSFAEPGAPVTIRESLAGRAFLLIGMLAVMWFIRVLDTIVPENFSAAGLGIVPRSWDGLSGILVAPFIHSSFGHLIANTIPFAVLGAVVLLNGVGEFLFVFVVSGLVAGIGTWLFGVSATQHVGASGIILGFMGFLLFRSAFDRKISSAVITLAVAVYYATALGWSLIPREDISWTGHFFGLLGGILAARLRYPGRERVSVDPESRVLPFRR